MRITPTARILLNVLVAATFVRLYGLGDYSLWLDEGATWSFANRPTLAETTFADRNHPPVWWWVTRATGSFLSDDEWGLRLPAAVLGIASVALVYLLARRLLDPARVPAGSGLRGVDARAPLWIAALAALNPTWIELSQEARMYSALLAESLGLSLLYLGWIDRGGRWRLVAYAALGALALHTHYYAFWTLLGHAVHAALSARDARRRGVDARGPAPFLVAVAAAGVLFVPWFLHARAGMQDFAPASPLDAVGYLAHSLWRISIGPALVVIDRARLVTSLWGILAQEWPAVTVACVLWLVPVGLGVARVRRDPALARWVAATLYVPLLAILAAQTLTPLTQERYVIGLTPALLLLAVVGARGAPRPLRFALVAGPFLLAATGFFAYRVPNAPISLALTNDHPYGKEQWREAQAWVDEHGSTSDPVFLHPHYLELVWDFYDRGRHRKVHLPHEPLTADELLARYPDLRTARRAFLVSAHEETKADHDHYLSTLREAWFRAPVEPDVGASFRFRAFPRQWGVRVLGLERGEPP